MLAQQHPVFEDNHGELVPKYQTIVSLAEARDDTSGSHATWNSVQSD